MFIEGVIFSALGISLITKAGLGTSPITSLAFVLTFLPKKLKKLKKVKKILALSKGIWYYKWALMRQCETPMRH